MPKPKKILIVKLGALGDVLRTTSLLRPLRTRYPGCRVTWLTSRAARPLLTGNPLVGRVLTSSSQVRSSGPFDLVLSLEEDRRAAAAAREACRGTFVGIYPEGNKLKYTDSSAVYYRMSLLNRGRGGGLRSADGFKKRNRHTYAELWLKALGLPKPADRRRLRPIFKLRAIDRRAARRLARRKGYLGRRPIGFNPGAGGRWPAKQLSIRSAGEWAAQWLLRFDRPVLLLGGREEGARNRAIARRARALAGPRARGKIYDAGTRHDLRSFAGIVESCAVVVTTDTLALHIANALARPVIVVVGPTSASELDVFTLGEKVMPAGGCSCFYRSRCRVAIHCLDRLSARAMAAKVGAWLR